MNWKTVPLSRVCSSKTSTTTLCHGSQAMSLVVLRGSVSEASTRRTLQSSTVCRRAVCLDRYCSCCSPLMCSSSLHVTVSVSTRTLTTLSCTYIHPLTTVKQRLLVSCIDDIGLWMSSNNLKLNAEKTVHLSRHAVSAGQSRRFRPCSQRLSCRSSSCSNLPRRHYRPGAVLYSLIISDDSLAAVSTV